MDRMNECFLLTLILFLKIFANPTSQTYDFRKEILEKLYHPYYPYLINNINFITLLYFLFYWYASASV